MLLAKFEIASKRSDSKCLVFVVSKENTFEGNWKKGMRTYSGILTIGGKSGRWVYANGSRVLAIYKEGIETPIMAMVNVPADFLQGGKTSTGDGTILLPGSTVEKERIEWTIIGVYRKKSNLGQRSIIEKTNVKEQNALFTGFKAV